MIFIFVLELPGNFKTKLCNWIYNSKVGRNPFELSPS